MAVKATPKALKKIETAEQEKGEELSKWEKVKVAGPSYVLEVMIGAATVTCVIGANLLTSRRQANKYRKCLRSGKRVVQTVSKQSKRDLR